jgi:hypothetical protein
MARPLVLVFQELATPQVTVTTPDLNTVIVGPAYDLLDYPDDATSIQLDATYGLADQSASYIPPGIGDEAVTVLSGAYPQQTPGSLVDHTSVAVTLKYPRVVLGSTNASVAPVLGSYVTTDAADQTLLTLSSPATGGFITAGVRAGDRVILTCSTGTVVRSVSTVGEPNAAGFATASSLLRLTQNLPATWDFAGHTSIRIERELLIQRLVDTSSTIITFPETGTDKLVIKGGVSLSVVIEPVPSVSTPSPASSTVSRLLAYSQLYLAYRAIRQDLQSLLQLDAGALVTVNGIPTVTGLGKIDSRNPLAVGVSVALQNSGTAPIFAYGVSSNDLVGHANARDALSTRRDLYAFVPLTQDVNVIAAYQSEFAAMANPSTALARGVVQKFRIVVGSVPLPTSTTIYEGSISGIASQPSGASTGLYRTITISPPSLGMGVASVLPGDTVIVGLTSSDPVWQSRRGVHRVSHVNQTLADGASNFEIIPGSSRWASNAGSAVDGSVELVIRAPDGTVKLSNLGVAAIGTGAAATAATGSITVPNGATLVDGDTLTLNDGTNPATVFEFDSGGGYDPAHVPITFTAGDDVATVAASVVSAINGVGATLRITAGTPTAGLIPLTNDVAGSAGNQTIGAPTYVTVVNMTGGADSTITGVHVVMKNATTVGGPYTIQYVVTSGVAAVGVSVTGFAIRVQVNGTSHTAQNVVTALNADPIVSTLLTATLTSGGSTVIGAGVGPVSVVPAANSCLAAVVVNDAIFNQLSDASAQFLTAGVKAGDVLEFPLDPNSYGPSAFSGRLLSYTVATVLNENGLLIANGLDDTDVSANELPHFYDRDIPNRLLTNTGTTALNYRIRRQLSKKDQVTSLITVAQSIRSKRCTLVWPDVVQVSDLRNGALPRTANVRALAGDVPGYYIGCQVGGAIAGLPSQHGLTNLGLAGINFLRHSQGYFTESQLTQVSDGGYFVMIQQVPGALPLCIHQLTTDPTAIETGELSVVKNVDFISKFFLDLLEPFIGVYNVTQATQNAILRAVDDGAASLMSRTLDRIGPPLISGEVTNIQVASFDASRIEVYFLGNVPKPLNTVAFHLVV